MNYGNIKNYDIANGEGVRVSLFVSGCRNHCKGCFQSETWDFNYGKPYNKQIEDTIMDMLSNPHISGLTILGGDPMEEENQKDVANLVKRVKRELPHINIWMYTGYDLPSIISGKMKHTGYTKNILENVDTIVDGKFELDKKDLSLYYRGSSNQKVWNKNSEGVFEMRKDIF